MNYNDIYPLDKIYSEKLGVAYAVCGAAVGGDSPAPGPGPDPTPSSLRFKTSVPNADRLFSEAVVNDTTDLWWFGKQYNGEGITIYEQTPVEFYFIKDYTGKYTAAGIHEDSDNHIYDYYYEYSEMFATLFDTYLDGEMTPYVDQIAISGTLTPVFPEGYEEPTGVTFTFTSATIRQRLAEEFKLILGGTTHDSLTEITGGILKCTPPTGCDHFTVTFDCRGVDIEYDDIYPETGTITFTSADMVSEGVYNKEVTLSGKYSYEESAYFSRVTFYDSSNNIIAEDVCPQYCEIPV